MRLLGKRMYVMVRLGANDVTEPPYNEILERVVATERLQLNDAYKTSVIQLEMNETVT